MRDALQRQKLDPVRRQALRHGAIHLFGAAQALLVLRGVAIRSLAHPLGHRAPRRTMQSKREVRAIAVIESPAPVAVGEVADAAQLRLGKMQRG